MTENRTAEGKFAPGNPGGGRPRGARSRLSETMLQLLAADAAENGAAVIAEVRKTKPTVWLQCVCSLLPKQLQTEKLSPFSDISDDELAQIEDMLVATRARMVQQIEHNGVAIVPEPVDAKQPEEP